MSTLPVPTPIYRIMHVANLQVVLQRGGLYAPNFEPKDNCAIRTIHNVSVQASRHDKQVPCGTGGTCHDYVPFYFGKKSVMLFQLKTGWVDGYAEGQQPIIYLRTNAQLVESSGLDCVFTDGHGLAAFTEWFDKFEHLSEVDWSIVNQTYWKDTPEDNDRKRRKQAEFLIKEFVPWNLVAEIGVLNKSAKDAVEAILGLHKDAYHPPVGIHPDWYY